MSKVIELAREAGIHISHHEECDVIGREEIERFYTLARADLEAENARLRDALHNISLCSQNSMSSQRQCGEIARAALGEKHNMTTFNPQYLKELRIKHRNTLDENLVDQVKQQILQANLKGRRSIEIAFRADRPWKAVVKHFEELGFWVGSSGYIETQYDDEGDEVVHFIFNWRIKEEWETK